MSIASLKEEVPPIGVHLSIPLDRLTHNDGNALYDVTKSWSSCQSIHNVIIDEQAETLGFDVEIWNLGALESSSTIVDCVLGFFISGQPVYRRIEERKWITIPGSDPDITSSVIVSYSSLNVKDIENLTHIYVSVYDPLYDPIEQTQGELLAEVAPVNPNPARITRKVGCLNLSMYRGIEPFYMRHDHVGLGTHEYRINVLSKFPPDIVLLQADAALGNFDLVDNPADILISELSDQPNTILNSKIQPWLDLAWSVHIEGESSASSDDWVSFLLWSDKGANTIDGEASVGGKVVRGSVLDAEYKVFVPNDPDRPVLGRAKVRFLAR